jgi:ATP-dependent Clp protease ATP-binding subunit ClpB
MVDKELTLKLTEKAKDYITQQAYEPTYGARPLKRYLQKNVETLLAKKILADEVKVGDVLTLDADESGLLVRV